MVENYKNKKVQSKVQELGEYNLVEEEKKIKAKKSNTMKATVVLENKAKYKGMWDNKTGEREGIGK